MDKIDLKHMWNDLHVGIHDNFYDEVNFRKTLKMNHGKSINKVLSDFKLKIIGYSLLLVLFAGLMIYSLVYLDLHLSEYTLLLFSFIGLFFFIKIILGINRLLVLTKTANTLSVKESVIFFRKKLNQIKMVDFLCYLIYFYSLAFLSSYGYIRDIGGIKNLFVWNAFQTLMLFVILILLFIPWLIKYQHSLNYRALYTNLNDSVNYLNEEI
jgi:hypothetical protein